MSKSRARFLAELLNSEGLVKPTASALAGGDGVIDLEVLPVLPNSQLEHSSISIAGHTLSLGASLSLDTSDITEHASYLYYTDARVRGALSVSGSLAYNSSTGVISFTTPTTIASLSNHDTDDLSEGGTNLYYTSARANSDFDTRFGTKTTADLSEGTNLYYTDGRVGSYLTTNSYATQTYVNTAVSNLVDSAPGTLDTLNELAAALGDDPNFATTVSNSIGTKWTQDNTKISNWDTAYSWGNHASVGYLTGNQTITLTGDVSGSGTTSISVTVADDSHNHIISNVDGLQSALDDKAPTGLTLTAGDGLSGGGTLAANRTFAVDSSVVRTSGDQTFTGDLKINKANASIYLNDSSGSPTNQGMRIRAESIDSGLPGSEGIGIIFEEDPTNGSPDTTPAVITTGEFYAQSSQKVFHDGYHPNADTFTTARTIALGGDVTGSASFNGSANITITAVVADDSHNHVISNVDGLQGALDGKVPTGRTLTAGDGLSGGGTLAANRTFAVDSTVVRTSGNQTIGGEKTFTSAVSISSASFGLLELDRSSGGFGSWIISPSSDHTAYSSSDALRFRYNGVDAVSINSDGNVSTNGGGYFLGDVSIGTGNLQMGTTTVIDSSRNLTNIGSGSFSGTVTAPTFSGALSGNASTASTWATARTITLGGDLSGSVSINGGSNVTLTATVADDSHNHIISNVDGLQTALNGKLNLTGGILTGTIEQSYSGTIWSHSEGTVRPVSRLTHSEVGSIGTAGVTITDVYGEADLAAIDNDATFTYADAWDAVESHGGRLPTLAELMDGVGLGSGQGYDNALLWTCTPAGPHHVWVALGNYTSSTRQIVDIKNPANVYRTRAFFDVSRDGKNVSYDHDGLLRIEGSNRAFHDGYHPNADAWTTARTITLGGDLSGSVSMNGGSNVTLTATVADDSHNHIISNVDGLQGALDGKLALTGGTLSGNLTVQGSAGFNSGGETASVYIGDSASEIRATYNGGTQIFVNAVSRVEIEGGTGNLNVKTGAIEIGGTTVIDSGREGSFATRASFGGIDSAGNVQPSLNNTVVSGYGLIGNRGTFYITNGGGTVQIGNGGIHNENATATFSTSSVNLAAGRSLQINGTTVIDASRNLTNIGSGSFSGTVTAPTFSGALSGNASTASTWATARTISLSNNASGSVSFSGSSNVSISTSLVPITINSSNNADILNDGIFSFAGNSPSNVADEYGILFQFTENQSQQLLQTYGGASNKVSLYGRRKTSGTWDTVWTQYFSDHYHPNADTWTTARTITLGGDLSGSVSINGGSNVTLTATVADDSHNHIISNVDGLQTALDGKAPTGRTLTAGDGLSGGGNLTANRTFAVDSTVVRTSGNQTIGGTKTFSSTIIGSISGNAATATKWATARTITLGGDLTGNVSIDGSSNVTLSAQVANNSHNHAITNITGLIDGTDFGGTYPFMHYIGNNRIFTHPNISYTGATETLNTTRLNASTSFKINGTTVIDASRNLTNIGSGSFSGNVGVGTASTSVTFSVLSPDYSVATFSRTGSGNPSIYLTNQNQGDLLNIGSRSDGRAFITTYGLGGLGIDTTTPSEKLDVAGNINATTGYKLNGTTVIDASRNLTNIGTLNGGTPWHSGNDGSGSGLDADTVDGLQASQFLRSDAADSTASTISFTGDIQVGDQIFHHGDTNTYLQFHAADQFRVVTGGVERLEVNNSAVTIAGTLNVRTAIDLADSDVLRMGSSDDFKMYYDGSANEMEFEMEAACNQIRIHDNGTTRFTLARATGTFTATGNVTAYSDERLKDNIETLDGSKVLEMRGVSFTKDDEIGSGVIAQELEKIAPELVHTAEDEMGTKSVAYGNLVGYLIEAVKLQQTQIDELKAQIEEIKNGD